jgi:hypothetical protein
MVQQVQIFLAPNFTPAQAVAVRASNPDALILNTINAEETVNGVPSVPDSYYLKSVNGSNIENWPGNPGNFILNLTNPAVVTMLAQYAYQQYAQTGFAYDGIFFDNVVTEISSVTTDCFGNPVQISAAGNGIATNPITLNAEWSAGVYSLIAQFQALAPNAYISGHLNQLPPDTRSLAIFNGDSLGFDVVDIREGTMAFGALYNTYQQWFAQGPNPVMTVIQSSPPNQIAYGYGYAPLQAMLPSTAAFGQTFYPNMRFGLAMALMNNGFFDFDFGDTSSPVAWWYDEYNFSLGAPVAPAVQLGAGPGPNQLINGSFANGQTPWLFSVVNDGEASATFSLDSGNPENGTPSAHVDVASSATVPWNIDFEEDNLALTAGTEYQVQFWAKADSNVNLQLAAQGGAPSYSPYGLNATVPIGTSWALYSVSFLSSATAADGRLEFWMGAMTGNIWLNGIQISTAPNEVYRRDFANGVVLLNGTSSTQTIPLESGLEHFSGQQAPAYQFIVDDSSSSFSTTGTWKVDTFSTGFRTAYGPYYNAWQNTCHELDTASGSATWNLGITQDGQYTIQAWLASPPVSSSWTNAAVYQVMAGSTALATATLNQSAASAGDQWFTIATVNLTAASNPVLTVSNGGTGPLIADAVYVFSTTAKYNNGLPLNQVTLAPMDGILLERQTPNQSISFPPPPNTTDWAAATTLGASASSGLPVTYIANTPSICSLAGSALSPIAVGTCSVTATQPGNTSYTAAVPVTQTLTVGPAILAPQTITFGSIGAMTMGTAPFALSASASSGLAVTLTSTTLPACTLSGNTVTLVAAGLCSITATQSGGKTWAAATPVIQTFNILAGNQSIAFAALANQVYGSAPLTASATATSGLAVGWGSNTPAVCTNSGNIVTLIATGTCSITASQAGNANWSPAVPVTQSFNITIGSQTIAFSPLPVQGLGGVPVGLTASASSGLPVSFSSTTSPICTVSGGTLTLLAIGTCSITAAQAGTSNWAAAPTVSQSFNVAANLLTNGGFESGSLTPWLFTESGSQTVASAALDTTVFESGAASARVTVTVPAPSNWQVGFEQDNLPVTLGTTYQVQFWAKADSARSIQVAIQGGAPGFAYYGLNTQVSIGAPWQLYTVSFVSTATANDGRLEFSFGATAGNVWLDDVQMFGSSAVYQTIAFTQPANVILGAPPITLVAAATSGLPVNFTSTTPSVCSLSGAVATLATSGTCSITAAQPGNATYFAASPVVLSFTVLVPQTLTFGSIANQTMAAAPFPLSATASSGLAVGLSSTTPSTCVMAGSTITLVAVGACSITASQPGNPIYAAAAPVIQVFSIAIGAQSINFPQPQLKLKAHAATLGQFSVSASASSGLPVSFSSNTPSLCTVSGATVSVLNAGTCSITATQPGNSNWAPATPVTQLFVISPGAQSITFTATPVQALGAMPFALNASATSGLPVTFTSSSPSVCSISGATVVSLAIGICSLTASQAGNANWLPASPISQSFNVGANLLTNGGFESGSLAPWLFSESGAQTVASAALDTTNFESGTASAHITVTVAAPSNWEVDVEQDSLPVNTGTTYQVQFWAMGDSARSIQVAIQGGAPSFAYYGLDTPLAIGTKWQLYTLTFVSTATASDGRLEFWFGATAGNVWLDDVQLFGAAAVPQSIAFVQPPNVTLGAPPAVLSVTAASGMPVSLSSTTPPVCTVSGSTVSFLLPGTCSLTASQAGNAIYLPALPVSRSFTVLTAQSITFGSLPNRAVGSAPFALSATASSSLTVSFASTPPSVCSLAGTTVTPTGIGTCTITASQSGNAVYAAASPVTQNFNVTIGTQTITFTAPANQVFGVGPVPLTATASSGLAVTFSSTTPLVCTTAGSILTVVAAGSCSITGSQAGNSNWSPAAPVTRTLSVALASQTITFAALPTQALGGMPFAVPAAASSGLSVGFSSTTTPVCTVAGNAVTLLTTGTCSLTANQAGNSNWMAAAPVSQSFKVSPNLLTNGGFESGTLSPWLFFANGAGTVASAALDTTVFESGTASARLTVTVPAAYNWQVDLEQDGLSVSSGSTYQVQFWAKASSARSIGVALQGGSPSFAYYGLNTQLSIGTTWALYSLPFVGSATAHDGRLEFSVGAVAGNVWLDDVQFFAH